jgi:hypothetical protein
MAERRETKRTTLDEAALAGLVVGVTQGGRLEWIAPQAAVQQAVSETTQAAVQSTIGAEVISDQERALAEANRQKIEELKTLPNPSPDLHDIVSEIMAMTHPPTISLAAAGWVLQLTGLIPLPVFDSAAAAVMGVSYIGRRVGYRLHAAQVPQEASDCATKLWQTHPGIAHQIVITLTGRIIDSLKNAASVDDSELEDELDAFYPRWSRTDFEFNPRRYQR